VAERDATPRTWPDRREVASARADIAAGEVLFNTRTRLASHCRSHRSREPAPHDTTPNVGDHSVALRLDLGLVHDPVQEHDPEIANSLAQLSLGMVPVYEIDRCPDPFAVPPSTGPVKIYTTDPGKALISGACGDFNRVKGPILRGLAARAPYFHNGAARNLNEVLNFYNQRFRMNLTATEKRQIIAFLNSL
jgi:cytochrome c peroxidase